MYNERHFIMINELISQKAITMCNVYALNIRASKYLKQQLIELKREIEKSTGIVGDFNIPLSVIDRTSTQKVSKNRNNFTSLSINST